MKPTKYEAEAKKHFLESKEFYATTYRARCLHCGKLYEVITQANGMAEYRVSLAVRCSACGGLVYFKIPVN